MKKISLSLLLTLVIVLVLNGCSSEAKSDGGFNYNDAKLKVFSLKQDGDYTYFTYEIIISKDTSNFDKLFELIYNGEFNGITINNTNMPRFHGNDSILGYGALYGNISDVNSLVLTCPDGREMKVKSMSKDIDYDKYNIVQTSMGNYGFYGWEVQDVSSYIATLRCFCNEFEGTERLPLEYFSSTLKIYDENGQGHSIVDMKYDPYTQTALNIQVECSYDNASDMRMYFSDWTATIIDEDGNDFYIKGEN